MWGAAYRTVPVAIAFTLLVPGSAEAQMACGDRSEILVQLKQRYAESPVAMGVAGNGAVLEVLAADNGTWTILVTRANGMTCVIAAGESWEQVARAEPRA